MQQGQTSAEGAQAQPGGMGLGLLTNLLGMFGGAAGPSGMSSAEGMTEPVMYGNQTAQFGNSPGGPSALAKMAQILSRPEVLQAIGGAAQGLSRGISQLDKLPSDQAAQLLQAATELMQGGTSTEEPFMGDIPKFSPQMAQTVLEALGIPGGFHPLVQR